MQTVFDVIRQLEKDDQSGTSTKISEYVNFNLRETVNTIEAYLNSKHISGEKDANGREKPFFNIVTAAANIWYRATDIDRKHISVKATKKSHYVISFIATILLRKFMRTSGFGMFLNEWGRVLARYGSAVLKFVEKDGKLHPSVIPWNTIICDPIDFENNVQIEKLWYTPAQLKQNKSYDKKFVKQLLDNTQSRKTSEGQQRDQKDDYIPVYECHGLMPLSFLTKKEKDEFEFTQQIHVVSFVERKEESDTFDEFTLYSGKESKSPYLITHLIKEDGRSLSIGAVEHLFQAQWMTNDNAKRIKDQLELASKILFTTTDANLANQNAFNSMINGDFVLYTPGTTVGRLSTNPDIGAMQSSMAQWQGQGTQSTNISESMQGKTAPSGTAWRQVEALLQESHSLFELMTENKGFYITKMLTDFVIPHFKKKMDNTDEISEILEEHQIKTIDARFVPNQVIRQVQQKQKQAILSGRVYTPEMEGTDRARARDQIQSTLSGMGRQRFIKPSEIGEKTWKEALKDLEWDLEIDITAEQKDTQAIMATLSTLYQQAAQNNPEQAQLILNRILEMTGAISPVELAQTPPPQQPQQQRQQPQRQPQRQEQPLQVAGV